MKFSRHCPNSNLSSFLALSPLLVFFMLFIGTGVYFSVQGKEYAFYQVSASVAILPAIIFAVCIARTPFQKTLSTFLEGARDNNIIVMCFVYLLAGAFAAVVQQIGGVTSIVHMVLSFMPAKATLPILFLLSAVISTAMGTSMGTIAAIAPIGVGIASSVGIPLPLTMGTIIGGAMFGDNLSMISDTCIAATQIHGATNIEKFKGNFLISMPTMIVTLIILIILGIENTQVSSLIAGISTTPTSDLSALNFQWLNCLPYLLVLGLALFGINVFVVLILGIICGGLVGIITHPSYALLNFAQNIFEGYKSMNEIMILSLLMGGLGGLIKQQGGFNLLTKGLERLILAQKKVSSKVAEGVIGLIASFCDICTANNTVAIILSGEATREIAKQHKIPPARTAILVDLFACVFQGILPYSAQVLMAGSLAKISPISIIPHVHYCYLLGVVGIGSILLQLPKRLTNRASVLHESM